MAITRDPYVTSKPGASASLGPLMSRSASGPAGVWTLDGEAVVASDADGPATVLVPSESVLLLAVDLPIASRVKRLAALPFAVEDRIADPIDAVHLAIGTELSPQRYLVGVVRHERMAAWIARVAAEGLDHAALVPDALALPRPAQGEWSVDLGTTRAVVRRGDGTGFAIPAPMLRTAWEAAGSPPIVAYGEPVPEDMALAGETLAIEPLGQRLLVPALDLRQGVYARRRAPIGGWGVRFARVAAAGIAAHVLIAGADTLALKNIAANRAEETRALVASVAPGTTLPADNFTGAVADLLPQPGAGGGSNAFLAAANRLSAALAPLGADVAAQSMSLNGTMLTLDIASSDPGLGGRVDAALKSAGLQASVAANAGGVRVTVPAA